MNVEVPLIAIPIELGVEQANIWLEKLCFVIDQNKRIFNIRNKKMRIFDYK